MFVSVINSGSKGNGYVIYGDGEALMIEAGVPFKDVLKQVGAEVCANIKACLLSHEHGDHAKYIKQYLDHGIPVYATSGTIEALKTKRSRILDPYNFRLNPNTPDDLAPWHVVTIGRFQVLPFRTVHDAKSPCGFYIRHPEFGNLLFATDTRFVPATFSELTNIMIECNYDEERLAARTDIPESLKDRIRDSHQSIDTCIEALNKNDLRHINMIMLIHISEGDGDPEDFRNRVQKATRVFNVVTAKKGADELLSITPF